jgi:hypothetical protein
MNADGGTEEERSTKIHERTLQWLRFQFVKQTDKDTEPRSHGHTGMRGQGDNTPTTHGRSKLTATRLSAQSATEIPFPVPECRSNGLSFDYPLESEQHVVNSPEVQFDL